MSNKITDLMFYHLSFKVYEDVYLNKNNSISIHEDEFIVIDCVNKKSGLQAMAVVSIADYEKIKTNLPPNNILFVSRGTDQFKDWTTNINQLATNFPVDKLKKISKYVQKTTDLPSYEKKISARPSSLNLIKVWGIECLVKDHQFIEYEAWVEDILTNLQPNDYTFTGHSLGGALAQYMGVIKDKRALTFSSARPYRILPQPYKELVNQGYYNRKIINYRHVNDPVGFIPFGKMIGQSYNVLSSSPNFIWGLGHVAASFSDKIFNSDGSIKII